MKKAFLLSGLLLFLITGAYSQETKPSKKRNALKEASAPEKSVQKTENESPAPTRKVGAAEPLNKGNSNKRTPERVDNSGFKATKEISEITKPIITPQTNGQIDWTNQFIEAKGEAVIDNERFKNSGQARAMAIRGATVVAQRNLLEIINGVYVVGETTVQDMMAVSDLIQTRVEGVLRGAQIVGEPVEKHGMMEVKMRVPLYQSNGLAAAVHDQVPQVVKGGNRSAEMHTVSSDAAEKSANKNLAGSEELQNVVFNLAGKKYDPALFPIITDENNQTLLDLSRFYDPSKGSFPKIMETSKEVMDIANLKKGTEIIDVIQASNGKFVVPEKVASKINWKKIGSSIGKVGSLLLMLL
jgi:hypothetical protein